MINVQFSDSSETKIIGIFGAPQDPSHWPNMGTVLDTDPRYIAFMTPPVMPDIAGFIDAIATTLGGIVPANTLAKAYPLLDGAIRNAQWSFVQALIIDAQTTSVITSTEYAAIKAAAAANNIPITL